MSHLHLGKRRLRGEACRVTAGEVQYQHQQQHLHLHQHLNQQKQTKEVAGGELLHQWPHICTAITSAHITSALCPSQHTDIIKGQHQQHIKHHNAHYRTRMSSKYNIIMSMVLFTAGGYRQKHENQHKALWNMDSIKISISVMLFEGDGRPPKYTTSFGRLPPCHLSQTLANIALYIQIQIHKHWQTLCCYAVNTNTNTRPSQTLANITL